MPRLLTRLVAVERAALAVLLGAMLAGGVLQFALRRLFHLSVDLLDRTAGVALLWLVMLGAAAGAAHGSHLAIDTIPLLFAARHRRRIAAATAGLSVAIAGALAFVAARFAVVELAFSGIAGGLSALAIPIGFTLLAVHAIGSVIAIR